MGPPAVGKMTVGQELSKLTGLTLFHNHMSLELGIQIFDFGTKELERIDKKYDLQFLKSLLKVTRKE